MGARPTGRVSRLAAVRGATGLLAAVLLVLLVTAPRARAADRLYFANESGGGDPLVAFANLDASFSGGNLVPGVANEFADGVAIDAAAGRLYYGRNVSGSADKISFVNLDGSGGGDLSTPGVTVNFPNGLAIDPAAGMLYLSNYGASQIVFARLDGGGAGTINTTGATVTGPIGVAIDPAGGRIYWANNSAPASPISFANLDGSGGGNLNTSGASTNSAWGLALDLPGGRVYWGNGNKISFARLDGSGGGDLATTGATVNSASGIAIDAAAGRLYWTTSSGDTLAFANLDGTGGGNLPAVGATIGGPSLPALLKRPAGTGIPTIEGDAAPGASLSCSQGTWAPDLLAANLYRVPQSFSFQWRRDGADIAGATSSTYTVTATDAGHELTCVVTATNAAGSASAESSAAQDATSPVTGLTGKGTQDVDKLALTVGSNEDAALNGSATVKLPAGDKKPVGSKPATANVTAGDKVKLRFKFAKKKLRKLKGALERGKRLKAKITVTATDAAGNVSTAAKTVKLKD